jgi:hypothetical protein
MTAGIAQIMRAFQFATVRAFLEGLDGQRVMAATHVAPRGRGLSLWDGHVGTYS